MIPQTGPSPFTFRRSVVPAKGATAGPTAFKPLPVGSRPNILFRVMHKGWHAWSSNCRSEDRDSDWSFDDESGDLRPRHPGYAWPVTPYDFENHLSWRSTATPFLSFVSDWERALQRRRRLIDAGASGVVVVAVWSWDLENLYDGYAIAQALGFRDGSAKTRDSGIFDLQKRRLQYHRDEYLLHGSILAEDARVLAILECDSLEVTPAMLSRKSAGLPFPAGTSVMVPKGWADEARARDTESLDPWCIEYELGREIPFLTGKKGSFESMALMCALAGVPCHISPRRNYDGKRVWSIVNDNGHWQWDEDEGEREEDIWRFDYDPGYELDMVHELRTPAHVDICQKQIESRLQRGILVLAPSMATLIRQELRARKRMLGLRSPWGMSRKRFSDIGLDMISHARKKSRQWF